jgi:hypothetical protein
VTAPSARLKKSWISTKIRRVASYRTCESAFTPEGDPFVRAVTFSMRDEYHMNSTSAIVVRTGSRAGGMTQRHDRAVGVKTGVKAGGLIQNHGQAIVKTGVRAGGVSNNHSQARPLSSRTEDAMSSNSAIVVRTGVKGGAITHNHAQAVLA